jgi:dipeptidyl aminopeptidase/acylaminoacyl peptidase
MQKRLLIAGALTALAAVGTAAYLIWLDGDSEQDLSAPGDLRHLEAPPGSRPEAWLDDRTILVTGRGGILRVDVETGRATPIALSVTSPTWIDVSPDRRWIAYAEHGESTERGLLGVLSLDGSTERVLARGSQIYELRWTRDGRAVAFKRALPLSRSPFWIVPRDGGRPLLLAQSDYDREDLVRFPVRRLTQPVNTRIGSWRVWSPPQLIRESATTDETCFAPVVSPNRRLVACIHQRRTLSDQLNEAGGETDLAVIRIS